MFEEITNDVQGVRYVKEKLEGVLEPEYADGLELIMNSVDAVKPQTLRLRLIRPWYAVCLIIPDRSSRFPWMSLAEASAVADVTMR